MAKDNGKASAANAAISSMEALRAKAKAELDARRLRKAELEEQFNALEAEKLTVNADIAALAKMCGETKSGEPPKPRGRRKKADEQQDAGASGAANEQPSENADVNTHAQA